MVNLEHLKFKKKKNRNFLSLNLPPSLSVFVCLSASVTQTHTHTHTVVQPTGPRCLFPFTRPPEAFGCTRPPHPHPRQLGSPLHCAEPPTPLRCLRLRASLSLSPFKGHILVLTLLTNPMSISCLFSSSLLRHAHLPGSPGSPAPHVLRRPIPGRVPRLLPAPVCPPAPRGPTCWGSPVVYGLTTPQDGLVAQSGLCGFPVA